MNCDCSYLLVSTLTAAASIHVAHDPNCKPWVNLLYREPERILQGTIERSWAEAEIFKRSKLSLVRSRHVGMVGIPDDNTSISAARGQKLFPIISSHAWCNSREKLKSHKRSVSHETNFGTPSKGNKTALPSCSSYSSEFSERTAQE